MSYKAFGLINEDEIYEALKDKRVSELSNNMRFMMVHLFGILDDKEVIKATKTCEFVKPDIMVTYKNKTLGISIKSNNSELVHCEQLSVFVDVLRSEGISEETIKTLQLFHYGDGTIDGTGKERLGYSEIKYRLLDRIKKANQELNASDERIIRIMNRCMFDGVREDAEKADAIYIGDVNYGVIATKEQIRRYTHGSKWSFYENFHIGPLILKPHARYVGKQVRNEKFRNQIDLYWPKLQSDLDFISRRYNFYDTPHKSYRDKYGK